VTLEIERALASIVAIIVAALDPDEIVLFGSVAKGVADAHSDVDLLVIGAFAGPKRHRGAEVRGLLDRYPLRFDLHLLTRAEEAAERARPHSWLATLRGHARVLYTRS
jgi:predicted nucleotidyltransferase